jgi:hypothetical protein
MDIRGEEGFFYSQRFSYVYYYGGEEENSRNKEGN